MKLPELLKTEKSNNKALIVFTREPEPGKTKTRLMPYFTQEQCAGLHSCMLRDISREMKSADADIIVAYTGGRNGPEFLRKTFGKTAVFIEQIGADIGARMKNAIKEALELGYDKVVLIGTDIPEIRAESVNDAFSKLDSSDIVLGPTEDGGYYLIGMSLVHPEAFEVKVYGTGSVFEETAESLRLADLSVALADKYPDIDTPEDISAYRKRMREDSSVRNSHTGRYIRDAARISVIIPVFNESGEVGCMMEQLREYKKECEIIFVDGGSTDDTVSRIGNAFTVISGEKGRGAQMNRGALESTGDILFFLHCDSLLPEGFDREIRRVMSVHDWGCFGVRFPSKNFFMLTNRIISNYRASMRKLPFGDQGIFIDRKLFFDTGMFPEIPLMEDYEFSLKMKQHGIAPGMTGKRLVSSDRRYGTGTKSILKTEICMWKLRRMYRRGVSPDVLRSYYNDVR